jgi:hypothetical protein
MEEQTVETPIYLLRDDLIGPRAQFLWIYLKAYEGDPRRLTQEHLCAAIGVGKDGRDLREAVSQLERQGWLRVDRKYHPHRYEVGKRETEETTLW